MRTLTLPAVLTLALLGAATPAFAEDDPEVTREDVERKKEEVREMERKLREQESEEEARRIQEELRRRRETSRDDDYYDDRRRRDRRSGDLQLWVGLGTGLSYGWVDTDCDPSGVGPECSEEGLLSTYIGNFTVAADNGMTLRLRGVRASDRGSDEHVPYETAAMVGARFGRSSWYGLFGAGVLHNVDDEFVKGDDTVTGLAWEVMFAPASNGPMGMELGFQGNSSEHAGFIAFNVGVRFGALR